MVQALHLRDSDSTSERLFFYLHMGHELIHHMLIIFSHTSLILDHVFLSHSNAMPQQTLSSTPRQSQPCDALIVIDVQHDFLPGGSLAVKHGDRVIPVINRLAPHFGMVVLTQDWHPANHISFADQHDGKQAFETMTLPYGPQTLWPRHCVQATHGAELSKDLSIPHAQLIIRKGFHQNVDSYSAFLEADRKTPTGLTGYLRERDIQHVYLCGLATDYCVAWSALDARTFGFEATVIEDASGAIDLDGSLEKAWSDMQEAGVRRVLSTSITG